MEQVSVLRLGVAPRQRHVTRPGITRALATLHQQHRQPRLALCEHDRDCGAAWALERADPSILERGADPSQLDGGAHLSIATRMTGHLTFSAKTKAFSLTATVEFRGTLGVASRPP